MFSRGLNLHMFHTVDVTLLTIRVLKLVQHLGDDVVCEMVREILVEVWSKGEGPSAAHGLEVLHYGLKGDTKHADRFNGIISLSFLGMHHFIRAFQGAISFGHSRVPFH